MSNSHNLIKIFNAPRPPVTVERIEEMVLFAAKLVDERGEVLRPILDRLEREYLAATRCRSETDRVRELIRRRTAIRGRLE